MATIKDVACMAGVSISTVSRVLNNSAPVINTKRKAVEDAMLNLGYRPNAHAQALVLRYSNTVGVMSVNNTSSIFYSMMQEIAYLLSKDNKQLILSCDQNISAIDELACLKRLLLSSCDTLIVQSDQLSDMELVKLLRFYPTAVIFGRRVSAMAHRCVYPDYKKSGFKATQYLTDLNHKKLGLVIPQGQFVSSQLLREGFQQGLISSGINPTPLLVKEAQPSADGGYQSTKALLATGFDISGIVFSNDIMASGGLKALNEAGKKTPHDLSIIACDDTGIAQYLYPAVTSVRQPIEVMARYATKLALNLVQQPDYTSINLPDKQTFTPVLVVRDSILPMVEVR